MRTLNPVEQKYIVDAINSLEEDGLIEIKQNGMLLLILTQRGFDIIYD
jgi:predicted transcriptional regulator